MERFRGAAGTHSMDAFVNVYSLYFLTTEFNYHVVSKQHFAADGGGPRQAIPYTPKLEQFIVIAKEASAEEVAEIWVKVPGSLDFSYKTFWPRAAGMHFSSVLTECENAETKGYRNRAKKIKDEGEEIWVQEFKQRKDSYTIVLRKRGDRYETWFPVPNRR